MPEIGICSMIRLIPGLLALVLAVQPPLEIQEIPKQIGRNAFYYESFNRDPSWLPSTLIFGPWESLGMGNLGIKQRPMKARVAIILPGQATAGAPISAYIETAVDVYDVEYAHHSVDLTLTAPSQTLLPYGLQTTKAEDIGFTKHLPGNWIPGSKSSPQLRMTEYLSAGEFVLSSAQQLLHQPFYSIRLGEWNVDVQSQALAQDLDRLVAEAKPHAPVKAKKHGR
jgi:hypothetical protein